MGIDCTKLPDEDESVGVGGVCLNYIEPAVLIFSDPGRALYIYNISIAICPPAPDIMDLPSLLGRDILDRWRMTYSPSQDRVTFRVISADATIRVPPPK
jgi:hypothetical protein